MSHEKESLDHVLPMAAADFHQAAMEASDGPAVSVVQADFVPPHKTRLAMLCVWRN